MAVRTVAELARQVQDDEVLKERIRADPVAALADAAYVSDPKFYRIAIGGLIGIIVLVLLGTFLAEVWAVPAGQQDKSLPDWVSAVATTALGGLVGLFAPSPVEK